MCIFRPFSKESPSDNPSKRSMGAPLRRIIILYRRRSVSTTGSAAVCSSQFGNNFTKSNASDRHQLCLPDPNIIWQSNHILAVYKPPGWQTVDMNEPGSRTCLLHHLKYTLKVGGGSDRSFLLPLHRLDQPTSGILLYGKTSKASKRIQPKWGEQVRKSYLALVSQNQVDELTARSCLVGSLGEAKYALSGRIQKNPFIQEYQRQQFIKPRGWSVVMIPTTPIGESSTTTVYRLTWRHLLSADNDNNVAVLHIQTNQGSRHMIRSLFQCHGASLLGDVRYGKSSALPDRSVALHARSLDLTKVRLPLGQRQFVAPIPETWSKWFGISEEKVAERLKREVEE